MREAVHVFPGRYTWEISVLSVQFRCEPKTALKNSLQKKKQPITALVQCHFPHLLLTKVVPGLAKFQGLEKLPSFMGTGKVTLYRICKTRAVVPLPLETIIFHLNMFFFKSLSILKRE